MGQFSRRRESLVIFFAMALALTWSSCGVKVEHQETSEIQLYTLTKRNTNVYVLKKGHDFIIIDAGYARDSSRFLQTLDELGLRMSHLKYIILTHAHGDHVGSAACFQRLSGAPIVAGEPDAAFMENGEQGKLCSTGFLASLLKMGIQNDFPPITPDILVSEGEHFELPGWDIQVELVAGHTPGSLIIWSPLGVFVGDLIRGRPLRQMKAARHYFMCDENDNDDDIDDLYDRSKALTWYPGHFGPLEPVPSSAVH